MSEETTEARPLLPSEATASVNNTDAAAEEPRTLGCTCGKVRFFQIKLQREIAPLHLIFYWFAVIITISAFVFINAVGGFVLTNFLKIPQDQQGTYVGDLAFWNEIAIIPTVFFWGWLSDKTGRMPVYVVALVIMSVGLLLHSFARTWEALVAYRLVFALGAAGAASMITALLGDYPSDEGRGRAGGIMGLCSGVGALLGVFVFLHIPEWFKTADVISSGQNMFYIVASLVFVGGLSLIFGLYRGKPTAAAHLSLITVLKDGFRAMKRLEIIVAYLSSFAARGDSFVAATFLTLWIHKYYIDHHMDPKEAIARAGMVSGIAQTCALVFAPFVGALADKITRMMTVFISAIIACAGYYAMFFINEPIGPEIIVAAVLIGCGEVGMIVSSQILVAVEAPEGARGAVSGFYGLCASLGILTATKLGGFLFDSWTEGAPFLIFAIANSVVGVASIAVYILRRIQARANVDIVV